MKNIHVGATEENGKLIFLHKILPGPADQSYGIHVAKLAGLPKKVLRDASTMLKRLEAQGAGEINEPVAEQLSLFAPAPEVSEPDSLAESRQDLLDEISQVDLNEQTPLEVMQLVADWQKKLKDEG